MIYLVSLYWIFVQYYVMLLWISTTFQTIFYNTLLEFIFDLWPAELRLAKKQLEQMLKDTKKY